MRDFKPRRCRNCGTGAIRLLAKAGRKERYRNLLIEVPAGLPIPTCDNCETEWMNESTAASLDAALESTYRGEVRKRFDRLLRAILEVINQRRLESIMGVSDGYISKLKRGEREPSMEFVTHLALIAKDPVARVREVEAYLEKPPQK
jgi:hypothetical protein